MSSPFLSAQPSSAVLRACILLCNHHHHPLIETVHLAKLKLCTFSIITPHFPSLQTLATATLLFISINLMTLDRSCKENRYCTIYAFCDCLVSLHITSSRFIHLLAVVRISSLFKAEEHSIVAIDHILRIRSPVSGYLACFHLLATVNRCTGPHFSPGETES